MTTTTAPPIDLSAVDVLCEDTSKLARSDWLALRRPYLGSSDAATTLGLNPWDHPYRLMAEKRGMMPDRAESEHMRWGRLVEPVILDEWRRRSDVRDVRHHVMLRSREFPFMAANPDGLTSDVVVEVKTADRFDRPRWDEGVPDHYVLQAMHLMIVTTRRASIFPVLFGGNEYEEYSVEWTQKVADNLLAAEQAFMERLARDEWPDPDGSEASMLALRARYLEWTPGVAVELPYEPFARMITLRAALAEEAGKATKEIEQIKAIVMERMGHANAERATLMGETVATWKATKSGTRRFTWSQR